ncbi:hypothetical protein ACFLSG_02155 [Candidatus Bipolaricaulota bacterium]
MTNAIHLAFGTKLSRLHLVVGLVALFLLVPILSASAQVEDVQITVLQTLVAVRDQQLALLVDVMAVLNESEDSINLFMEGPRLFLFNEGIDFEPDRFQITGVNFLLPPAVEEEPWFGIAEPLEGLLFEPKGVGIFYSNVGILIQEAFAPVEEGTANEETNQKLDMLQFIDERFQGNTLDLVRDVMRELEELGPEDPQRLEFLANPREYLVGKDLTFPATFYRITAVDMNRAEAAGGVISDEIRPGLGTIKEGIGVFYENVGIFLQRAI